MKWTLYQVLTLVLLSLLMWGLEFISDKRAFQFQSAGWAVVIPGYATVLIIALVISCFFLIFLFEAKKEKSIFQNSAWRKMPVICLITGLFSVFLFIAAGAFGPLFEWVEQWRFLLYIFFVYFLLLLFLFIFSLEHRNKGYRRPYEKTIKISYFWTLILFVAFYLLL
ncbi:hypothetical protein [Sutcliffiella deserti]|uniref:hypothetical protein n=1 Tax=Sutcliffiella deserti TaxID=2875501 RepID=UPI001CBCB8EC|nr:hypothetical protein [Sutcliffiella deserti]